MESVLPRFVPAGLQGCPRPHGFAIISCHQLTFFSPNGQDENIFAASGDLGRLLYWFSPILRKINKIWP